MKKFKQSYSSQIKSHIIITAIIAVLIIGILITIAVGYRSRSTETVINVSTAVSMSSAKGTANAIGSYFDRRISILTNLSGLFRNCENADESEIEKILEYCADMNLFDDIAYINKDGIAYHSDGRIKNVSHRALFRQGIIGEKTTFLNIDNEFDASNYDIYSVPVYNGNGEIIAVLSGMDTPLSVEGVDYVEIAGNADCYYLVDERGTILMAPENSPVRLRVGDDIFAKTGDTKGLDYYLNIREASQSVVTEVNGEACIISCVSIPGSVWSLLAVTPYDVLKSYLGGMFVTTLWVVIITITVIAILTAVLIIRMLGLSKHFSGYVAENKKSYYVDEITKYPSWNSFKEHYPDFMKNTGTSYALISLDIDKFKTINDSLGFEGGNEVLRQLADIISRNINKTDMFARSSGDLFYILFAYDNISDVRNIVSNIINDVDYMDKTVKMYICMGVYLIIDHNTTVETAVGRANLARRSVKDQKQSSYAFFDNAMIERIRDERSIESIMEEALIKKEFKVYLQPKYSLEEGNELVGAEALVRWLHDGTLITPNRFIPVFEKNGFIVQLDYYMFEEVCKLQKKWLEMGHKPKIVSVNMSRLHLRSKHFVEDLVAICNKYDIATKYFEIEITESAAYENLDILLLVFEKIKKVGFHVSIDDFGTGYSSLNMLKDLKVDVLKIDRSFLTESADENENASRIIACVVALAASLNISTICEGIETKEQADLLKKLGCNMAQGYFFARPMPVADYEKLAYLK